MGQCWRCGGEMPSYAVRCTWCGRSTFATAFFQVISLAVVTVALLLITGVLPFAKLVEWYPGLSKWAPRPAASAAQAGEVSGGQGGQGGQGGRGYGEVGRVAPNEQGGQGGRDGGSGRDDAQRGGQGGQGGQVDDDCATGARARTLALANPGWTAGDVGLIACRQVRVGFTEDQVRASLGRPREVNEPSGASPVSVWVYRQQRVVFERDTVVGVR